MTNITPDTDPAQAARDLGPPPAEQVRTSRERKQKLTEYIEGHTQEHVEVVITPAVKTAAVVPATEEALLETENTEFAPDEARALIDQVQGDYLVLVRAEGADIGRLPINDQLTADRAMQFGLAFHELLHILHTAIGDIAALVDQTVDEAYHDQVHDLLNTGEDGAIEHHGRDAFSVNAGDRLELTRRLFSEFPDDIDDGEQVTFSFWDAVTSAFYDYVIYETGVTEVLTNPSDDRIQFASKADEEAFEIVDPALQELAGDLLELPDSVARAERIIETWKQDIKPLLDDRDGQDQARDNDRAGPSDAEDQQPQYEDTQASTEQSEASQEGDEPPAPSRDQPPEEASEGSDTTARAEADGEQGAEDSLGESGSEESPSTGENDASLDQERGVDGVDGEAIDAQEAATAITDAATESDGQVQDASPSSSRPADIDPEEITSEREATTDPFQNVLEQPDIGEERSADTLESDQVDERNDGTASGSKEDSVDVGHENGSEPPSTGERDESNERGSGADHSEEATPTGDPDEADPDEADADWEIGDAGVARTNDDPSGDRSERNSEGEDEGKNEGENTADDENESRDKDPSDAMDLAPHTSDTEQQEQLTFGDFGSESGSTTSAGASEERDEGSSQPDEPDDETSEVDAPDADNAGEPPDEGANADERIDEGPNDTSIDTEADSTNPGDKASDTVEGGASKEAGESEITPAHGEPSLDQDSLEADRNAAHDEAERNTPDSHALEDELRDVTQVLADRDDTSSDSDSPAMDDHGQGAGDGTLDSLSVMPLPDEPVAPQRWEAIETNAEQIGETLAKYLALDRQDATRSGLTAGQLDQRQLDRVALGDPRGFATDLPGDEKRYDLVIVLDRSGSMRNGQPAKITSAVEAVTRFAIAAEALGINVAVIDFVHAEARLVKPFSVETEHAKAALLNEETGGGTPLSDALGLGCELVEQRRHEPLLIVITDGKPKSVEAVQEELKQCYAPVCAFSIATDCRDGNPPYKAAELEAFYDRHLYVYHEETLDRRLDQFASLFAGF